MLFDLNSDNKAQLCLKQLFDITHALLQTVQISLSMNVARVLSSLDRAPDNCVII